MIRLGWRLALAGGRESAVAIGLTALAVALGTAFLLFALSFEPAMATRYDHAAWRDTPGFVDAETADEGLMISRTDDHVLGRPLSRMDVAALSSDAPVPPGLPRVPGPGEAFVSPALASLIEMLPADELGDRFGPVVGTIGPVGLRAPDELAAVVGRDPEALRADGARIVTRFDGAGEIPMPPDPLMRILVVIAVIGALAPVAVFVGSASRLAAARREQRLAAVRLVGGTPRQVAVFAAVEALAATVPGALGGVVLFLLLRPAIALVPLDQATWFVEAIAPPIGPAVALLALVQVVGLVAAIVALRRVNISPLGVRRRERPRPLGRLRLVPLAASLAVLALGVLLAATASANGQGVLNEQLWLIGGGFFGTIVGIALAGPWITALVGRALALVAGGPAGILAGRRLADDPRAAFGAIGGVVMAVFVGSAYLSIASFATSVAPMEERLAVDPHVLLATVPGDGFGTDSALAELRAVEGVETVAVVREVGLEAEDGVLQLGVVADCEALVAVLSVRDAACTDALVHTVAGIRPVTDAAVTTARYLGPASGQSPIQTEDVRLRVSEDAVAPYTRAAVERENAFELPAIIVEPEAFADGGAALPVTRIAVATDGSPGAIERARTAVQVALPTSVVRTVSEAANDGAAMVIELGRVVSLGIIVAMLLAGASLAISVTTGVVERQRPFALLRLAGMPIGRLRAVLVLEAAAPLVTVAALSAVLGSAVAQLLLRASPNLGAPLPDLGVAALLAVAVAGALAVVLAALPLVDRVTATEATRFE